VNKYEFKITEQFEDEVSGYYPSNRVLSFEGEFAECVSWEVPLKSFVDFLSAWYGYNISDHIHTESIMDSKIFKHIPRDDDLAKRVRAAMEEVEEDDWK
jgi:hypothetical protein